jgi:hypothetical protein
MCEHCEDKSEESAKNRPPTQRRLKLKDINHTLYCSIIGTCLSMGDLHKVARKAKATFDRDVTDYDVHSHFVHAMGKHELLTRLVNKLLDKKHESHLRKTRTLKSEDELIDYWLESRQAGDIPGPYWALISHPLTSNALQSRLFGDVHMLSHLVGAANRADIKRLQEMEDTNDRLEESLANKQQQYRNDLIARDNEILKLRSELACSAQNAVRIKSLENRLQNYEDGSMTAAMQAQIEALQSENDRVNSQLEVTVQQSKRDKAELDELRALTINLKAELDSAMLERVSLEKMMETRLLEQCGQCIDGKSQSIPEAFQLDGTTVLYVGGRPSQIRFMRQLVERAGGKLEHHDGGLEDNDHRLIQMLSRGDIVMCPIDCVSHSACERAKKFCRHNGKSFVPLRSSGLSSFVAGLENLN